MLKYGASWSTGLGGGVAAAAIIALVCAPQPADAAADATLVTGAPPRRVTLHPAAAGSSSGVLALALRNRTGAPLALTVRYLRDDGGRPVIVCDGRRRRAGGGAEDKRPARGDRGASRTRPLPVALAHPRQSLVLRPHAVGQLALRFHGLPGHDASALDGLVVIRTHRLVAPSPPQPPEPPWPPPPDPPDPDPPAGDPPGDQRLVVPVRVAFGAPAGLALAPRRLTMHIDEWFPRGITTGRTAKVDLHGVAAPRMRAQEGRLTGHALLRNDDGDAISVHWTIANGGAAITVDGDPAAGAYHGTLPLLANTAAPAIELTVKDRHAWLWAYLFVLLGALVGGFLPALGTLHRRKVLLAATVRQDIEDYRKARRKLDDQRPTWVDDELGDVDEPWSSPPWFAQPRMHGAAGFFSEVRWARDRDDLDAAEQRAIEIESSVRWWLQVNERAQPLRDAAEEDELLPRLAGRAWSDTAVARDTDRVLARARTKPADDDQAERRVRDLKRQHERHTRLAQTWRRLVAAEAAGDVRHDLVQRLLALACPSGGAPDRDADWDAFEVDRVALERAVAALPVAPPPPAAKPKRKGPFSGLGKSRQAAPSQAASPQAPASGGEDPLARFLRRKFGEGSAADALFTVWLSDLALTGVATLVALVGYTLAVYSDTFGSPTSYAEAFAAGLATQAVARWVAMPIFDSIRLRNREAQTGRTAPA